MFKNIIIYSDCRGRGIYHFLKTKVNGNVKLIQICDLPNFEKDPSNFLVDKSLLNDLQTCDIFIYMFIGKGLRFIQLIQNIRIICYLF